MCKRSRAKKSGTKINGGTKITCCGVELSKDILKILADKTKKYETAVEHTLGLVVADVCFKEDERSQVRELLKQSNGNVTDDKIDEIVACLASPQGITCFYYSSIQFYQKYLKEKSSDVQDLLKKVLKVLVHPVVWTIREIFLWVMLNMLMKWILL